MDSKNVGYMKSFVEIDIKFDEEKERRFKSILDENFGCRSKEKKFQVGALDKLGILEKDFGNRTSEIKHFRRLSQSAVLSPLLNKALVKKTKKFLSHSKITQEKLTPIQKFRSVARMVMIFVTLSSRWKRYNFDSVSITSRDSSKQGSGFGESFLEGEPRIREENEGNKKRKWKTKVSEELQNVLRKSPELRTSDDLIKVQRYCRKIGALSNFPVEREFDVARCIGYECYGKGRVICLQGRIPIRFYYIIGGKVTVLKTVELTDGIRKKYLSELQQGNTTDPNELQTIKPRKSSLVAKCFVEVLVIEKEDFMDFLFSKPELNDVNAVFLKSLQLFQTYPFASVEKETIRTKYFPKDTVVVQNIEDSPYFYVVKSGTCKLLQKYSLDDRGVPIIKKSFLPRIGRSSLAVSSASTESWEEPRALADAKQLHDDLSAFLRGKDECRKEVTMKKNVDVEKQQKRFSLTVSQAKLRKPRSKRRKEVPTLSELVFGGQKTESKRGSIPGHFSPKNEADIHLPLITANHRMMEAASFRQAHVPEIPIHTPLSLNSSRKEQEREAYFQVGILKPGDIYGLESLKKSAACMVEPGVGFTASNICKSGNHEVTAISEGTECILINKKLFFKTADFFTMSRIAAVDQGSSPAHDAKMQIEKTRNWECYKKKLVDDVLHRSKARNKRNCAQWSFL